MVCIRCGKAISEGEVFCSACMSELKVQSIDQKKLHEMPDAPVIAEEDQEELEELCKEEEVPARAVAAEEKKPNRIAAALKSEELAKKLSSGLLGVLLFAALLAVCFSISYLQKNAAGLTEIGSAGSSTSNVTLAVYCLAISGILCVLFLIDIFLLHRRNIRLFFISCAIPFLLAGLCGILSTFWPGIISIAIGMFFAFLFTRIGTSGKTEQEDKHKSIWRMGGMITNLVIVFACGILLILGAWYIPGSSTNQPVVKGNADSAAYGNETKKQSETEDETAVKVVVVPLLTGLQVKDAVKELDALDLVAEIEYVQSDAEYGEVVKQGYIENAQVEVHSLVVLQVSMGATTTGITQEESTTRISATEEPTAEESTEGHSETQDLAGGAPSTAPVTKPPTAPPTKPPSTTAPTTARPPSTTAPTTAKPPSTTAKPPSTTVPTTTQPPATTTPTTVAPTTVVPTIPPFIDPDEEIQLDAD